MKPAMGPIQYGENSKDDQIVDLRVALQVESHKVHRLLEELMKTRAEAAAAKTKIATLEEEKRSRSRSCPSRVSSG